MILENDLSRLLGLLYASPLDDSKWTTFLAQLSEVVQTTSGALISHDGVTKTHSLVAYAGLEASPEPLHLYNNYYGQFDPFLAPVLTRMPNGLIDGDDLVDRSQFMKTEFYNELLRPHDMEHAVLIVASEPQSIQAISLWRNVHQGPLKPESRNLLNLLVPHVRSALNLRRVIKTAELRYTRAEATLQRMATAAILLDSQQRVCLMNLEAERILFQQDGLSLSRGELKASDYGSQKKLLDLISRCGTPKAQPQGALRISRPSGRDAFQLLVSPIKLPDQEDDAPSHVLVIITDSEDQPRASADTLNALYGLTPAETTIANGLLSGLSPQEIADQRRVSIGTVRDQLKSLLSKTGTRRQSDLVRILAYTPRQNTNGA